MMLFECFKSLSRKFTVRTRDTFFLRRFWVYSSLVQFSKFGGVFNKKNSIPHDSRLLDMRWL